jgi:ribonuclease HII
MQKDISRKEVADLLAGLDEVGMGCLAGPLCIAIVAFPKDFPKIEGVRDSKKLSRTKREKLAPQILEACSFFGIGWAHPQLVDSLGIAKAWQYAATMAVGHLPVVGCLYVDGMRRVTSYVGHQVVEDHGEDKWWQVAAASIVAKVTRDHDMREMDKVYPGYGFAKHVGYGTKDHTQKILAMGPCPYHRKTFLKKLYRQQTVFLALVVAKSSHQPNAATCRTPQ